MWHKLFRSKSTKSTSTPGQQPNGITDEDANQVPQVLRCDDFNSGNIGSGNNATQQQQQQLTTNNIATVRKHKNKLSNPFKRSGGSGSRNGGGTDSSSKRQCSGGFNTNNISPFSTPSSPEVPNVYGSVDLHNLHNNQTALFSFGTQSTQVNLQSSASPYTTAVSKDSYGNTTRTNLGISNGSEGAVAVRPVNDRQLTTFSTFNGCTNNNTNSNHYGGVGSQNFGNDGVIEDNRKIRATLAAGNNV